jgi:hypothetical protein
MVVTEQPEALRRRRRGRDRATSVNKTVLALPVPRRIRDREHVKSVAKQPCLVCGRRPADAHHLRFAQPSALGRKVSDEFTVPFVEGTIAKFIAAATRLRGGRTPVSIQVPRPAAFG